VELAPPDPELADAVVVLRLFDRGDAAAVAAACADPGIVRFTFMQEEMTEDDAVAWIDRVNEAWSNGHPRFAIVDPHDGRLLGQVGIYVVAHQRSAEGFYWVAAGERRRGVAAHALGLVADWAFETGIERLFLLIHPENEPSNRLAASMGFTREGVLRAYEPFKGGRPDLVSWSLLPGDPRPWTS